MKSRYLTVAIATLVLAAGLAAAGGSCTTAYIGEPFSLPDGSAYSAGELKLCVERNHSPVASMHELRVNGMGVGLFMSRRETTVGLPDTPGSYVVFHRANGELALVGVVNPLREGMQMHFLHRDTRAEAAQTDLVALKNDPSMVFVPAQGI